MFYEDLKKKINNREYSLYLNNKNIKIRTKRIKGIKNQFDSLIVNGILSQEKSFFIYNEKNIATYGLSNELDIVWVNFDEKIINIEENFPKNKISKEIPKTKYIYIFSAGTVKRKRIILSDILKHKYDR